MFFTSAFPNFELFIFEYIFLNCYIQYYTQGRTVLLYIVGVARLPRCLSVVSFIFGEVAY